MQGLTLAMQSLNSVVSALAIAWGVTETHMNQHIFISKSKSFLSGGDRLSAMRVFGFLTLLCLVSLGRGSAPTPPVSGRAQESLDHGWMFRTGDLDYFATPPLDVTGWQFKTTTDKTVPTDTSGWKPYVIGANAFPGRNDRFAWFVTTLPSTVAGKHPALRFVSAADNATVYLNGKKTAYHEGWDQAFDVSLKVPDWHPGAPNVVAVLVQNIRMFGRNEGGLLKPVQFIPDCESFAGPAKTDFNDSSWRNVNVPHDYVAEGTPLASTGDGSHGYLPRKIAWYRRTFNLKATSVGKRLWLEFEGVYRASQVWVNGTLVGRHESGYTSFYYDVTRLCKTGRNVVAVRVDPIGSEGWWYEGGGIYRHVWLTAVSPVHVAHWGTFVRATEVDLNGGPAKIAISTELANESSAPVSLTLTSTIFDPFGQRVTGMVSASRLARSGTNGVEQTISVPHPKLWSLSNRSLYRLRSEVSIGKKVIDSYETTFGIRQLRFDATEGLFLNGEHVKVNGTANHQDVPVLGVGVPDSLWAWRIRKLQALGCNGYRSAHNPPAPAFLDACDQMGMLVIDENRHMGDTFAEKAGPDSPYADYSELESMIRRDRNHPSIFMWSLCNEEWNLQGSKVGKQILVAMKAAARKLDTTRPIGAAWNAGGGNSEFDDVVDIIGWNYAYDKYSPFHSKHSKTPMIGTEIAAQNSTRGVYEDDLAHGHATSYDDQRTATWLSWTQPAQESWKAVATSPFMVGGFVWTGFDYRGESGWGWPEINGNWGMFDLAGFPKDVAWFYKSAWKPNVPVVHIFPHWNWEGKEGKPIRVWVYSNADEVELSLNGASLGKKPVPANGHAEWTVPYAKGKLEAVGRKVNGNSWGKDSVQTTGAVRYLRFDTDSRSLFKADPDYVLPVEISLTDGKGNIVPTSGNEIEFSITGPATIVGFSNGDTGDPTGDSSMRCRAFGGRCIVLIRSTGQRGRVRLRASTEGVGKPMSVFLAR